MYGYVYLITNLVNGKKYIGQHRSSSFDQSYWGSGKLLRSAYKKYPEDSQWSREVLEECDSKESLNEREKFWISYYNAVNSSQFYNITPGGDNFNPYLGLPPEEYERVSQKISDSQTGTRWMNDGSVEVRVKEDKFEEFISKGFSFGQLPSHRNLGNRNGMYGRGHSEEVCKKLVECNLGSNNPNYGKHWYTDGKSEVFVLDSDLKDYPGFERGRLARPDRKVFVPNNRGTILINNGEVTKRVRPEDYESYDKSVWVRGKLWSTLRNKLR